jgi:6-phosphogluconolactonase (cycloisomerase 2 family)
LSFVPDLSSTSFTTNFSVSSQDTEPEGITFNDDGTKMYIAGNTNNSIFQYTLTTAYDLSSASYASKSFSTGSQETSPTGVKFNTDGTKMFVVGYGSDAVQEYALSTAFDVSTASHTRSFSVSTEDSEPRDLHFNSDGTKLFVLGNTGNDVNEYAVATGFDLSSVTYTQNFSVGSQEDSPSGLTFNSDGTKMYICGITDDEVNEYSLTTGFDLSTASFVTNYSVSSQDTEPTGIAFSANGTKMFILGNADNDVNEYSLSLTFALGAGSFASADVGKTIEANSGVFILTSTAGAYSETTAPSSYAQVASGSWQMYGVVFNTTDGDLELSGITTGQFDVSTASFSQNFSVSAQEASPLGVTFNTDGTKMFITGQSGDDVNEYNLTTGFDVSTASYSQNFSVSSQETNPHGVVFNTDGTKMFVVGSGGDDVNEYNLTTGFDVSTASYSQNFSVSSQDTNPRSIAFNSDGTKMFMLGSNGADVNEYTLSSGFDVSTASYSQNFSVSSQESVPEGMAFNTDGTKMFITGTSGDDVNEYTLSTGFDVSTASYSQNFSVSAQETEPTGIAFNSDGTKMFIVGTNGIEVNEYTLGSTAIPTGYQAVHTTTSTDSTYWTDINSMTADEAAGDGSIYYCVSTDDRTTWKIAKGTDGERSIVRNNSGTWQYNSNGTYASTTWTNATTNAELNALQEAMEASGVNNAYDISTASFVDSFDVSSQETDPRDVRFNTDGTKMFVIGTFGGKVQEYTLTTGFDVSTASFSQFFSVYSQETDARGLAFNNDGTKMFVVGIDGDDVNEYTLSTGFDVSTASYSQNFSVASQETAPQGITFNNDGTKMFIVGNVGDDVNEYTLTTGFDVSTASYSQNFSVASQETAPSGIAFNADGTKMFICGGGGDDVNEYTLTTGFDVSTASYTQNFSVSSQETSVEGVTFNNDGSKMFLVGIDGDDVNEYTVGTVVYPNQMNKTQLDAVSDANHFTLSNDLDLAIVFNLASGTTVPSSDGVSINYDANVLNKGAILGTDYDYDAPAQNKVRITALTGNNLKVRVV